MWEVCTRTCLRCVPLTLRKTDCRSGTGRGVGWGWLKEGAVLSSVVICRCAVQSLCCAALPPAVPRLPDAVFTSKCARPAFAPLKVAAPQVIRTLQLQLYFFCCSTGGRQTLETVHLQIFFAPACL